MADISLATKRLLKEIAELKCELPPLVEEAGPKDSNLFEWSCVIKGPQGTVYENGKFRLSILFSGTYPMDPPKVMFKTKIYHCNISASGRICLDLLKAEHWSPSMTVGSLLTSIISLLSECNPNDGLQPTVTGMFLRDRARHDQIAKLWTAKFAL